MKWMLFSLMLATISVVQANATELPKGESPLDALYADFDPTRDPLEIEILSTREEPAYRIEKIRFTGQTWLDHKIRVFGYIGKPTASGKHPGIMHIHGGGQTASQEWVDFWAKRGYVCISFDFCGPWEQRTEFTHYGPLQLGMAGPGPNTFQPSPAYNAWVHWVKLARRALTVLASDPATDSSRIGVFGISVGGTLTWMVAATDQRVKCAAPIYGCGWNTYTQPLQRPEDWTSTETQLRRSTIEAETYAPRVKVPVLFFNASNDFHGNMDRGWDTLRLAASESKRWVLTANSNHHIEPIEGKSLTAFFDWQLRSGNPLPRTPQLRIDNGELDARMLLEAANSGQIETVRFYYNLNRAWNGSRLWRGGINARREGERWTAEAPIFSRGETIHAFANVTWKSGVTLTSNLVSVPASMLNVRPTLKRDSRIDAMDNSAWWYYGPGYTDPIPKGSYFKPWTDGKLTGFTLWPQEEKGAAGNNFEILTHALGEAQFHEAGHNTLMLDYHAGRAPSKLTVEVTECDAQPNSRRYARQLIFTTGTLGVEAGGGWIRLELPNGSMLDTAGKPLASWSLVDRLTLKGEWQGQPPVFKNLRWSKMPES